MRQHYDYHKGYIMQRSNFHTHTTYSDGAKSPREVIEAAIAAGFHSIGFSDHSYAKTLESYSMSIEGTGQCFEEIGELAEEYRGKIAVYNGIELDAESPLPELPYDYLIASVHELVRRGISMPVDNTRETQIQLIDTLYGGDTMAFCENYCRALAEHVKRNRTDIVGHIDLPAKFSLIDEESPVYREMMLETVRDIFPWCDTFEVNTGAIARGLRTVPYPAPFILDEIKRLGGRVLITSDCHYPEKLTCWFPEAEAYLQAHGFVRREDDDLNNVVKHIETWR